MAGEMQKLAFLELLQVKRSLALDVLRGIAVLMVLVYHNYLMHLGFTSSPPMLNFLARGVDLFFVLSGFLISGLLFAEFKERGSINCWRFWARRGFKIYPAFYALMVSGLLMILGKHLSISLFWHECLFIQNYRLGYWPHTWSLAVEEHFYLALPLLLLLLIKILPKSQNPFRILPIISVVFSAACFILRLKALVRGGGVQDYVFPTHLRVDALFAGVTLGYFYHFDNSFSEGKKWWMLAFGLFLCCVCVPIPSLFQLAFAYPAFAMILAWSLNQPETRFRYLSPLAWVGRYSYSIYLWHVTAFALVTRFLPLSSWLLTYIVASIVLGVILAKVIEIPFLRLRQRLVPPSRTNRDSSISAAEIRYGMA